jgi:dipeptidyl aminopeptidase/acylaminoacyl peptidase
MGFKYFRHYPPIDDIGKNLLRKSFAFYVSASSLAAMKWFYRNVALILLFASGIPGIAAETPGRDELIDILFSNPLFLDARLSPTGQYLASLSHYKGKRSVLILDLETKEFTGVTVRMGEDISSFDWIDDSQIVYHVTKWEIYTEGVYVYSVKSRRARQILDPRDSEMIYRGIVDPLLHKEGELVLMASRRDGANPPDLYLVDTDSDRLRKIAENTGEIVHYIVDAEGVPLYALEMRAGKISVLEWTEAGEWGPADSTDEDIQPLGMLPGNRYLLTAATNEEGFTGVNLLDLKTGEFPDSPRFVPGYDLIASGGSPIIDNLNGYLIGLHFNSAKPVNFWFDESTRRIEDLLKTAFPAHKLEYLGYRPDSNCVYFIVSSDTIPPAIYQVDLNGGKLARVYQQLPQAAELEFRPMEPVSFPSGDGGTTIHGYLTKPEGPGPYPTVLLVHGGPHVRDTWGFDPEVQFLALNGYAVLQVNYRGSAGYGNAYELSSLGEVADVAVGDVIAGTKWLIAEGIADPDHLAIMGGSFGGFITLAAAAQEPSLWKAAIGFAGVYDLNALFKQDNRRDYDWVDDLFKDYDEELYAELSPANNASAIEVPVLIIHGKNDRRVSASQAKDMIRALKKADKPVDSLFISWGVHGLPEEKDRKKYYTRILSFLAENM